MTHFARRRAAGVAVLLVISTAAWLTAGTMRIALRRPEAWLGWILLGAVAFLSAYGLRKKLSMLPLGASSRWLQFHIYIGVLTFPLFLLHTGGRIPSGMIELPLGVLYLCVFCSGILGLVLTRHIPPRLTASREEVIYERIPAHIQQLREAAKEAVSSLSGEGSSEVVAILYQEKLIPFFQCPRNLVRHILHSRVPRKELVRSLDDVRRFLNESEQVAIGRLIELVHQKDELDYQHAMQTLLKYWLFIHIPMSWAMLVFAGFHVFVARSYTPLSPMELNG